jgi:hypothetical protein
MRYSSGISFLRLHLVPTPAISFPRSEGVKKLTFQTNLAFFPKNDRPESLRNDDQPTVRYKGHPEKIAI